MSESVTKSFWTCFRQEGTTESAHSVVTSVSCEQISVHEKHNPHAAQDEAENLEKGGKRGRQEQRTLRKTPEARLVGKHESSARPNLFNQDGAIANWLIATVGCTDVADAKTSNRVFLTTRLARLALKTLLFAFGNSAKESQLRSFRRTSTAPMA